MSEPPSEAKPVRDTLPPADFYDPVIEVYKKNVDRAVLRENLQLAVEERLRKAQSLLDSLERSRGAARLQDGPEIEPPTTG